MPAGQPKVRSSVHARPLLRAHTRMAAGGCILGACVASSGARRPRVQHGSSQPARSHRYLVSRPLAPAAHPHGSRRLHPWCLRGRAHAPRLSFWTRGASAQPPLRTCLQATRRFDPRCMRGLCCARTPAWQPEVVSLVPVWQALAHAARASSTAPASLPARIAIWSLARSPQLHSRMTAEGCILGACVAGPDAQAFGAAGGWILSACAASAVHAHPHGSQRLYPRCMRTLPGCHSGHLARRHSFWHSSSQPSCSPRRRLSPPARLGARAASHGACACMAAGG